MGIGVLAAVLAPDVESRPALLPHARRADPLHCGGGYLFFDWAPLSGNTAAGRACAAEGHSSAGCRRAVLLRRELHVGDCGEYEWYRCPVASLRSGDDCSGVWVTGDPPDQWWRVAGDGEGGGGP